MNRVFSLLAITGTLIAILSTTFSFAEEDHVTIKRVVGDIYEITISGERNGDFANLQMVRTARNSIRYTDPILYGSHPNLDIYALVVSGGDENARSTYSLTFQEELPFLVCGINYFVADNYADFGNPELVDWLTLDNYNRMYDSHHDDGYYFGVDLTNSSIESQAKDTITIRNLKVEDLENPFKATFQWNPRNFKFELKEAGPDN